MDRSWHRFWANVEVAPNGCWLWRGYVRPNGYGQCHRNTLAHRFAYERLVGSVPEGLEIDHLCRNRACVNPAHMEPVTRGENLRRSPLMGQSQTIKTHCPRGHAYEGDNLLILSGKRHCRACRNAARKRRRQDPAQRERILVQERFHARESRRRKAGGELGVPNGEKTHCPQGHPLSGENLSVTPQGARRCRQCMREANARAYRRRKQRA